MSAATTISTGALPAATHLSLASRNCFSSTEPRAAAARMPQSSSMLVIF
jgi:hypothetical protein